MIIKSHLLYSNHVLSQMCFFAYGKFYENCKKIQEKKDSILNAI